MAAITPYGRRSMQVVALNAGETVGEWGTCNLSQHTEQRTCTRRGTPPSARVRGEILREMYA